MRLIHVKTHNLRHIRLVRKTIAKGPLVLIVSGSRDIVAALTLLFRQDNCRVYHLADFEKKTFPSDYIIFLGEETQLLPILTLAKRCRARVAIITETLDHLSTIQKILIKQFFSDGVDIRIGEVDLGQQGDIVAQKIKQALFSTNPLTPKIIASWGNLPVPPPPVPYPPPPQKHVAKKTTTPRKSKSPKYNLWPVFFSTTALLVLLVAGTSGYFFWRFSNVLQKTRNVYQHLGAGMLTSSEVAETQARIESLQEQYLWVKRLLGPLGSSAPMEDSASALDLSHRAILLARRGVNVAKLAKDTSSSIFANQPVPLLTTLTQIHSELTGTQEDIGEMTQRLSRLEQSSLFQLPLLTPFKKDIRIAIEQLKEASSIITLGKTLLPTLPKLVGLEGKRVYLILLQNNMELRPTGGFIGSYGLVTVDKGHIVNLTIEDIYAADGQLRGHIDPPRPLSKYLFAEHWYMRDSNFDPDFVASAKQAEWFLYKELGSSVDGVIALDLTFAKRVLDAIGGLELPDYDEKITSSNFFLKAQVAIEENFFAGSTRKRDFLSSFGRALLREFSTSKNLSWMRLGHALKRSLDEKHILVSLHEASTQATFEEAGWSGRLLPVRCHKTDLSCTADYSLLVDTNVGVNKANYYLSRSLAHLLSFKNKVVEHLVTVNYTNDSPADVFPSGPYKNYGRWYIPLTAYDMHLSIDGAEFSPTDIDKAVWEDKVVLGFYIEVPVRERREITLRYSLPLSQGPITHAYQLLVQKQAGTDKDPLHLAISEQGAAFLSANFPLKKGETTSFGPPLVNGNAFTYNSDLSVDRVFSLVIK